MWDSGKGECGTVGGVSVGGVWDSGKGECGTVGRVSVGQWEG